MQLSEGILDMPTKAKAKNNAAARTRAISASAHAKAWYDEMVAKGAELMSLTGMAMSITDDLTPERAHILLSRNDHNRVLSETRIEQFARDIVNGHFPYNGESVIVSNDGWLNDGQHRSHAVIRAKRSIRTVFVFGPERDTRLTVDQAGPKSAGDYLSMEGITDANCVAATAGLVWQYRNLGLVSKTSSLKPNRGEIRQILVDDPKIFQSVKAIPFAGGTMKVGGRSLLAFCRHIFSEASSPQIADDFISKLVVGADLSPLSPILRTRNRLSEKKPLIGRLPIQAKAELLFRTWNAWRRNEESRRSVALTGEPLPTVEA